MAVIKITTKGNLVGKGFIRLPHPGPQSFEGSQGRKLRQEPEGKNQSKCHGGAQHYWFALHNLFDLLSYFPQDHLPMDGAALCGLGDSTFHQSRKEPTEQPSESIFSVEASSSPMCSSLCQLDHNKIKQNHPGQYF